MLVCASVCAFVYVLMCEYRVYLRESERERVLVCYSVCMLVCVCMCVCVGVCVCV